MPPMEGIFPKTPAPGPHPSGNSLNFLAFENPHPQINLVTK